MLGDNRPQPVGCPWTTLCTACGSSPGPQAVEILRPRVHRLLTCPDAWPNGCLWTLLGTTSQSPGCGRRKVPESVERDRNQASNRTPGGARDDTPVGVESAMRASRNSRGRALTAPCTASPEGRGGGVRAGEPGWRCGLRRLRGGRGAPPSRATAGPRSGRNRSGHATRAPWDVAVQGALGAAALGRRQPFLMRLVSSVTWL
jgi:hypothetical protein